jgi:GntR family transcriptional regulator, transcriptional repressor for pyruvate dehydrogenase complex
VNTLLRDLNLSLGEPLGPEKPAAQAGRVLQQVRNLIRRSGLKPGMKLPPERILAAQLKVGRPALREAIKALSILDVLESRRGDGTYVKSLEGLSPEGTPKIAALDPAFDMIELLEVRKMIEPRAAALAAARATEKQLREIKEELVIQESHPENYTLLELHDYRFHDAIVSAAGNQILEELANMLAPQLIKSRQFTARRTYSAKVLEQHRTIFEAIRLGESELAEQAMKEHLQSVGLDLISERKR